MIYTFITITICGLFAIYLLTTAKNVDNMAARVNTERAKVWLALAFMSALCYHWGIVIK